MGGEGNVLRVQDMDEHGRPIQREAARDQAPAELVEDVGRPLRAGSAVEQPVDDVAHRPRSSSRLRGAARPTVSAAPAARPRSPSLGRLVVALRAPCRRGNSPGRRTGRARRGRRRSPGRSRAASSGRVGALRMCSGGGSEPCSLGRALGGAVGEVGRVRLGRQRQIERGLRPAPARPRASPAARRSRPRPGSSTSACGSARPISSTAIRTSRRAR